VASSRRLSAIMFTDMVGYTARTQADEAGTLALLREQEKLVRPLIEAHHGRAVKSTGDGFLAEFPSALQAAECAVAIQQSLHERNREANIAPIELRIGVHLGDVEQREDDIFGDAVNIASRVQPAAEEGGVALSQQVFDQVRNKLALPLEKLGPMTMKGVRFPMDVYRIVFPWSARTVGRPEATREPLLEPTRMVVLPFANISPDPADEYFADGMTEELIEKLAHVTGFRVIARTTAMHYKNSRDTALQIGRALRVGTVVECSVRKAGNRIRITAQLIDTNTEEHLWASRYDRQLDDIFAIQDEISGHITTAISSRLSATGATALPAVVHVQQDTKDITAYTHFLRGLKLLGDKVSETTVREALGEFQEAVGRDPHFARARVGLAEALMWLETEAVVPRVETDQRVRQELALALGQDGSLAEAHSALAGLLLGADEIELAEKEARRAIELNPSLSDPYRWMAQLAAGAGRIDETVRFLEEAVLVNPVDINVISFLGRAYVYAGREADALAHWKRTGSMVPFRTNAHRAEYYLGRGEYGEAEKALREMERLRPESVWTEMYRGFLAARKGDVEGARRSIERLDSRGHGAGPTVFMSGFVHYALGEQDAFIGALEESFRQHDLPFLELQYSRLFGAAREDPRVRDLLRRQRELRTPPR